MNAKERQLLDLIHREYMNAFPAKLIIEQGQVRTENSNKPHGFGILNPATFTPFPKNPVIAKFFRQIGRADEQELQAALGLKDDEHFRKFYLLPSLNAGLFEMTIPDKPKSSKQKYRLTEAGRIMQAHRTKTKDR